MLFETFVSNLVSITHPSLQILGKTQMGVLLIPGFWSILYKKNCHNSRTSDGIDMKLGPVTKPDKSNKTTSKKFYVEFVSEICDVIVVFRIFGQFGGIWRPDSGHRVCKSYVFSNSNLLPYKN